LLAITLVTLITTTIYGLATYLHYCDTTKECKFNRRSDDDNNSAYDYYYYYDGQAKIDKSVDFVVIIIASAVCTVWWVSEYK